MRMMANAMVPTTASPRASVGGAGGSCDLPEQCAQLADEPVAVETLRDYRAAGLGESSGQVVVAVEPEQRMRRRNRILGRHDQPARLMLHQLWDAADRGCDHWQPARHRFDEHVGNAVAIAVVADAARQAEDRRLPILAEQGGLRHRTGDADVALQPAARDASDERIGVVPRLTNYRRVERNAPSGQLRARVDQHVEALLGHLTADADDAEARRAPCGRGTELAAHQRGKLRIQTVVDAVNR